MAELVSYKPSKAGMYADFLGIKYEEVKTEGWWKGQLFRHLNYFSPVSTIDGKQCFGSTFFIHAGTCSYPNPSNDNEEHIQDFLKLLGVDEDAMNNICATANNEDVNAIYWDWKFTSDYSNDALYAFHLSMYYDLNNIDKIIEITTTQQFQTLGFSGYEIKNLYDTSFANGDDSASGTIIQLLDSNGDDITSNYNSNIINYIKGLCGKNRTFVSEDSKVLESLSFIEAISEDEDDYYLVTTETILDYHFAREISDGESERCRVIESYGIYDPEFDLISYLGKLIWDERERYGTPDGIDDGVIYKASNGKYYMLYDEFRKYNTKKLASVFSLYSFMDVHTDSGGFLGIGGFVGDFIGGLFDAIALFISGFASFLLKFPVLKAWYEFYVWLYTGDKDKSDEELEAILTIVILLIISILLTVSSGNPSWIVYTSATVATVGAYYQLEQTELQFDINEKIKARENDSKDDEYEEFNMKLSDPSNFYATIEQVLNPLDLLYKEQGYDVFARGGQFEPSFELK